MSITMYFRSKLLSRLVFASTLAIASWLGGCGNGSPGAKAVDTPPALVHTDASPADNGSAGSRRAKPCEYMLRSDAEAALGLPLPNTAENISLGTCDYTTLEFYGASLTVGAWESMKTAATGGRHQPVAISGVGDEALNLNGASGSLLYVRKGERGFLLTINGPQVDGLPDHGLEREKTFAQKILPKL